MKRKNEVKCKIMFLSKRLHQNVFEDSVHLTGIISTNTKSAIVTTMEKCASSYSRKFFYILLVLIAIY